MFSHFTLFRVKREELICTRKTNIIILKINFVRHDDIQLKKLCIVTVQLILQFDKSTRTSTFQIQ